MRLTSHSIDNGKPIPTEFAAGTPEGFAPNRNPHLAWSEVPEGTRGFALLCLDPDVPSVPETVGRDDVQIPVDQPRTDFVHWAMADIPQACVRLRPAAAAMALWPRASSSRRARPARARA